MTAMMTKLNTQGESGGQSEEEQKDGSSYSIASSEFDDLKLDDKRNVGDYFSFHPKKRSVVGKLFVVVDLCTVTASFLSYEHIKAATSFKSILSHTEPIESGEYQPRKTAIFLREGPGNTYFQIYSNTSHLL